MIKTKDEKIADAQAAAQEAHKEAKKAIKKARKARRAVKAAEEAMVVEDIINQPIGETAESEESQEA